MVSLWRFHSSVVRATSRNACMKDFSFTSRELALGTYDQYLRFTQISVLREERRYFSDSGNSRSSDRKFKLDALTFTVSPERALDKFYTWASDEQGLYFYSNVRIGASYVPVWSFDLNVRFVTIERNGRREFIRKPQVFSVYKDQSVVHIPGLAAYAGHTYRRPLVNPIVNTTLVFLGEKTQPFGQWMLRDMQLSNGTKVQIFPDPWNATRGRALNVVLDEMRDIARETDRNMDVEAEVLGARRVYIPVFVIDYQVFGANYRAFVSGCDDGTTVSGVSHRFWEPNRYEKAAGSFLYSSLSAVARSRDGQRLLFVLLGRFATLILRLPVFSAAAAFVFGYFKFFQPWLRERQGAVDWEHQRDHEASMEDRYEFVNDFEDPGGAKRFFMKNRAAILRHLSGDHERTQGTYDWFNQWEQWAYEQNQKQGQSTQRKKASSRTSSREYHWDFDPNDPYSVLGVPPSASKADISRAFRREMLKWHPDTQTNASDAHKERALARSKIITEAYRKLKSK